MSPLDPTRTAPLAPPTPTPTSTPPPSESREAIRAALARELNGPDSDDLPAAFPAIPDHTLLQRIGRGAYGDVWLARNALGTLRAVKIVHRARFKDDRPYEREFKGILKYEPISRSHEGLVQVLHVGRNDQAGCFYYVMELADAEGAQGECPAGPGVDPGPTIPPSPPRAPFDSYSPHTLRSELGRRRRLNATEAAQLVLRLAGAVAHLHAHGLVHRDIKPANVIFVGGQPKLADIGLVTDAGDSHSFVGTEGFIPPEGPGSAQADLYGLGKVLYELATGRDRTDFPQLPPDVMRLPDGEAVLELNEVMTRACAPERPKRYASAAEFQAELNLFLAGHSLRRARNVERNLARLKSFAAAATVFLALAAVALSLSRREERHARERADAANAQARLEATSRAKETRLRQRAEDAEHATQQQLYTALLEQARATVRSGEMGHRVRALDALRRAAALSNTVALRSEVIAALALPDLRFDRELPYGASFTLRRLDPAFERIALARGRGPVEIHSTRDGRLLATLPASTNHPAFNNAEWSADGIYLAVKRDHGVGGARGDWEVWDVAASRQVLLRRNVPWAAVSFHPRMKRLMAASADGDAAVVDLETGVEAHRFPLTTPPIRLRYAPEGDRFAALQPVREGWKVSVHRATNGGPVVSHVFTDYTPAIEWHPDGRWLAVSDHGGAIHAMDARTGEVRDFGRHKGEAPAVSFSADGAYLISGAWVDEMICWDARTLRRLFTIGLETSQVQFRADGGALAAVTDAGVRLNDFERPSGHREFAEDLGGRLRHAAFSADGRWLAASAAGRMGLWDLSRDGPPARVDEGYEAHLFFSTDGQELFGSRSNSRDSAGFRWRLVPASDPAAPPVVIPLSLRQPEGFTFLSLHSNAVVMTGVNGSRVLGPSEIESGPEQWIPTAPGINEVSPDGRWLAIYRPYSSVAYIYRLPGLERVARLSHPANISAFNFSPQGDELALFSRAGVEFWSAATWKRTRLWTNFVHVLYSPDGHSLWLRKDSRTAGLYDAVTLEPRLLLPSRMIPLALSASGRQLAVSMDGRRLQVWDLAEVREQLRGLGLEW